MSYQPQFTITLALLARVEQIAAVRERILAATVEVPWIPALQKDTRTRNTHSSTAIEGNPLVAWYVAAYGAEVAIVGAKGLALACGTALHLRAMHRTIGALTIIYLTAAVWPWFQIFTGAVAP